MPSPVLCRPCTPVAPLKFRMQIGVGGNGKTALFSVKFVFHFLFFWPGGSFCIRSLSLSVGHMYIQIEFWLQSHKKIFV